MNQTQTRRVPFRRRCLALLLTLSMVLPLLPAGVFAVGTDFTIDSPDGKLTYNAATGLATGTITLGDSFIYQYDTTVVLLSSTQPKSLTAKPDLGYANDEPTALKPDVIENYDVPILPFAYQVVTKEQLAVSKTVNVSFSIPRQAIKDKITANSTDYDTNLKEVEYSLFLVNSNNVVDYKVALTIPLQEAAVVVSRPFNVVVPVGDTSAIPINITNIVPGSTASNFVATYEGAGSADLEAMTFPTLNDANPTDTFDLQLSTTGAAGTTGKLTVKYSDGVGGTGTFYVNLWFVNKIPFEATEIELPSVGAKNPSTITKINMNEKVEVSGTQLPAGKYTYFITVDSANTHLDESTGSFVLEKSTTGDTGSTFLGITSTGLTNLGDQFSAYVTAQDADHDYGELVITFYANAIAIANRPLSIGDTTRRVLVIPIHYGSGKTQLQAPTLTRDKNPSSNGASNGSVILSAPAYAAAAGLTYDLYKDGALYRTGVSAGTLTGLPAGTYYVQATIAADKAEEYEWSGTANNGQSNSVTLIDPAAEYTISATADASNTTEAGGTVKVGNGTAGTTSSDTVTDGSSITLVATADTGYTFIKWQDAGGNQVSTSATYTIDSVTGTTPKSYTAIFEATLYTVTYNSNGGGTAPSSVTQTLPGASVTLDSGSGMSKPGHSFLGWSTSSTATSADAGAGGASYTPPNNITLYAVWDRTVGDVTVSVHLDGNAWNTTTDGTLPTVILRQGTGSTGAEKTGTANTANGTYSFADVTPGTYTVLVGAGKDTTKDTPTGNNVTVTVEKGKGATATVNYYTVTASVDATPTSKNVQVGGGSTAKVLSSHTATLTSAPADGYGGTVSWTDDGANSSIAASGATGGTITVYETVTAKATYQANQVKVTVLLNGGTDIAALGFDNNTITLHATDKPTLTGTLTGNVDTFNEAIDGVTYNIFVGGVDTGLTVAGIDGRDTNAPNQTLHYYDVYLAATETGGSAASVTYQKNSSATSATTSWASAAAKVTTILVNAADTFNDHTFNVSATNSSTNYEHTWTAKNTTGAAGTWTPNPPKGTGTTAVTATWEAPTAASGSGAITLDPNFVRTGVGVTVTVRLDEAAAGTGNLDVKLSTDTAGNNNIVNRTTDGSGVVTFDSLKASTEYYVRVTTTGWSGVYELTTKDNADSSETLNYYTVTALNGTGSTGAAAAATHVLAGTPTTLSSTPDYAHGYGTDGSWDDDPNPETGGDPAGPIGSASTVSGTARNATITVNGKVTVTANYKANKITVEIYKNGVLETSGTGRTVSLRNGDGTGGTTVTTFGSGSGSASDSTASTGKVIFSPVDSTTTTSNETYYIYVNDEYTGHTVTCAPGFENTAKLYYYDVTFADVNDTNNNGHYGTSASTVAKPASVEVLAGGPNNTVTLPAVAPVSADYDHKGWTMTPPTDTLTDIPGDFKKTDNSTAKDTTDATGKTGTADAAKWVINDGYTKDTTSLDPDGITLTPIFAPNGKYSIEIQVELNGSPVPDDKPATVTLRPTAGSGGNVESDQTSGGSVSFSGLTDSYTITVTDGSGATARTYRGTLPQVTSTTTNPLKLEFFEFSATVASAPPVGANEGSITRGSADGVYYKGTTVTVTGAPNDGYHFDEWNGTVGGTAITPVKDPEYSAGISGKTDIVVSFAPNTTLVNSYTASGTYGSDRFTSDAPTGNSGTSVTVATMKATGIASETFTYSEVTLPAGWPDGVTINWGGGTTADGGATYTGGNGTITLSGKPQNVTAAAGLTVTFKAKSSNGGAEVNGSFKLIVSKATPTIKVGYQTTALGFPVTKTVSNTFVGDLTTSAATVTEISGPYWDPTKLGDDKWVTLNRSTTGMSWTLSPAKLDNQTNTVTGTLAYDPDGAGEGAPVDLTQIWTTNQGTGTINATRTYDVTIQVRRNGSTNTGTETVAGAELRDGFAVLLTKTGYSSDSGGVTYTIGSTGHNVVVKVPGGTYTLTLSKDSTTDKKQTANITGNTTVYVDYYDVNYATLAAATDHLLYGTSTTAAKALVLVDAATDSTTSKTVTLPGVTGQGNYTLDRWIQNKPTASAGTFADATTDGSDWSITTGYHTDLTGQDPAGITLKPTAKTTGTTRKVTIHVDGAVDSAATPVSGVTKVELWSKGTTPAKVYETTAGGPHTLVKGVATFENITAGTYEIRVSNGTAVPSGVDLVTATGDAIVDFYKVQFTDKAVQKHYDAWSDTIKDDKTVTATATVFGVADKALTSGDAVLKGTDVTYTVAAWAPADYALSWAGTGVTAGSTANPLTVAVTQKMTSPVTATLTQNVYPVTGKTDNSAGGNFTDVTSVQYVVTQTGGDGTTLATLKMPTHISYNTGNGQFTTTATTLTGSAGKLPAGFTYTLSANSSDWSQTLITGYKVDSGTPTTYPTTVFFAVTAGADTQPVPWIILDGAEFSFRLDHEDVDPAETDVSGYTWPAVDWGYTQATDAPTKTVTIVNTGNRPLTNVKVVAKTPAGGANFVLGPIVDSTGAAVDTIPVKGKATFTVRPIADLGAGSYSQVYTVSTTKVQPGKDYTVNLTVNKVPMDYATLTLDPPKEDQNPTANIAGKTDEYKEYYTDSVVWHDVTGGGDTVMGATDKFAASHEYQAVVTLTPNADHYFVAEGSLPDHTDKKYTINTAWYGGPEGSYGGRMIDRQVNTGNGTVTLVYKFKALKGGTPVPSLEQVSYEKGKLTKITVKSDNAANIYYVLVPSDVVLTDTDAQAIKDVASGTSATLPGSVTPIIFGKTDSAGSTAGTVTWNVNREFPGDPGKTYTAYAVADIGGTLTGVGRSSVTLPKKLTVTITNDSPDGGTVTKVNGTYPSINGTTGTLALNGTAGNRSEILSITGAADFTVTPGNLTGSEVDNDQAWAVQKIVNKRTSDEDGTVTSILTKVPPIKYWALTNVTEIDVTFRQRIHGKPTVTGTAGLGNDLTVTKGAAVIGTNTEVVLSGDGKNVSIQWQYHPVSETDPNAWTNIPTTGGAGTPTATTATLTIPNDSTYAGAGFRVVLTYDNAADAALDGENNLTIFSSVTQTVAATTSNLETPEPKLYKVETGSGDATPAGVTLADKDKGGLYLLFEPSASETVAKATYKVTLTGGAIPAATPLTVTIDPDTPSTEWTKVKVNVDLGGGAKDYYAIRWPANWDNVRPGNNGTSSYSDFTARVQAVTDLPGWNDSPITGNNGKSNTSAAGRRVLKQTDLTSDEFKDRPFNGSAQTGIGASGATTTSNPVTGQVRTIDTLFQRDGGVQKGTAVGTIHIQYANNAAGDTKEDTKTHVNITEATTTPPDTWDPANKHDYYTYVKVDQGGLYLALEQFAFNLTDPSQDPDWKITQATPTLSFTKNTLTSELDQTVHLTDCGPKVTYDTGKTTWPDPDGGTPNVTDQFDYAYSVTAWTGGPPTEGTDYTLTGTDFVPKSTGTFTITVTATYKDSAKPQFRADLKEPESKTFTVGGELGVYEGIELTPVTREATYGVPDDTKTWYDTTDNGTSKYISLAGITVTEHWTNMNPTYDLGELDPANITAISNGGTAEKVDGVLKIKFPNANNSQRTITFKVTTTREDKSGSKKQTTNEVVTLILNARPVNYMTDSTKAVDPDMTYPNKIWNGGRQVPNGRIQIKSPETEVNEGVLDGDTVSVAAAVAGNVQLSGTNVSAADQLADQWKIQPTGGVGALNTSTGLDGTDAGFYKWGSHPIQGTMNVKPAHVDLIQIAISGVTRSQPVSGAVATITRNDEPNTGSATSGRGLSQVEDIKWQVWDRNANDGAGGWVDVTTPNFQVDSLYRATVKVQADGNHYLQDNKANRIYSIEGKIDGESISEEQPDRTRVSVTVDTDPEHGVFGTYNNIATFVAYYDTTETPELQFSDRVGSSDSDHHSPATSVVHVESVTVGDSLRNYTINLGSAIKDVLDVSVSTTNKELLDKGAVLTPITATTRATMRPGVAEDQISYTLDLSNVNTSQPGSYTLMLAAKGSSSEENLAGGVYNVSGTYAFVLVISEKQIVPTPSGGGGTTTIIYPVVKYWVSENGYTDDLTAEKMTRQKGGKPTFVPKITPMPGLKFLGWSETDPTKLKEGVLPTLVDPLTFSIDEDKVFYAVYERVDIGHSHYVIGFPDGTFGPDNPITRGQVATIIARSCLEDFVEGGSYGNPGNYTDVEKHWANSAIAYCSMKGVFTGYEDGTFRPDRYISRQELATVVARLAGVEVNQGLPFTDTEDISSWALNGVYTNYANKWVNGYEDGSFKPLNNITRAETVKIFNGYLGRGVDREGLSELREYVHTGTASNIQDGTKEYMTWPDVAKNHWAYYEVIEAANDHNFRWRDTTKAAPPEEWYEAFIDATWRYVDDANDGADDVGRDELPVFTVTYVVKSNGVTWDSVTEQVTKFSSPDPAKLPKAEPSEGYRFAGWSDVDPDEGQINLVDPTASAVLEDKTFYAVFEAKLVITYVIGDHGDADREVLTERINKGDSPTTTNLPNITAHEGWRFAGWSETDPATGVITLTDPTDHPAYADSTFYATYAREGEYVMPQVTVTYVLGDRGESDGTLVQTFDQYESPRVELLPQVTAREGWEFLGWSETDPANGDYALTDPTAQSILADKSFYAVYQSRDPAPTEPKDPTEEPGDEPSLPVEDPPAVEPAEPLAPVEEDPNQTPAEPTEPPAESHEPAEPLPPVEDLPLEYARKRYINGYTDNTFRPDDAFTRAAVATVLANLMEYDPEADYGDVTFTDLEVNGEEHWATNAITFCVSEGLMSGYTDGTFRPDNPISRQEFAVVLTRLTGETETGDLPFTDADSIAPWAADSVYTVYAQGWISGYGDGTFLPERNVTRAEAVKMLNRYLDRPADGEFIESQSGYTVWADVPETHWAYYEIIEASNDWLE